MGNNKVLPRTRRRIDRKALAQRRIEAIESYRKGLTQYRIAKRLGVSFEAVSNWIEVYKKYGMRGLESLGKPGPKPKFSKGGKRKIRTAVSKKSKPVSHQKEVQSSDLDIRENKKPIWSRLFKLIGKE